MPSVCRSQFRSVRKGSCSQELRTPGQHLVCITTFLVQVSPFGALYGVAFPRVPAQIALSGGGVENLETCCSTLTSSQYFSPPTLPPPGPPAPGFIKGQELLAQSSLGNKMIPPICVDMSVSSPGPFHEKKMKHSGSRYLLSGLLFMLL